MKSDGDAAAEEVAVCKTGDYFGERSLVENEPRAATIKAITEVTALRLDRQAFSLLMGPLEDIMKQQV
jgi:CRP-like cAMP-binding protein